MFTGFTPVPDPVCMESLGMETGKIPDSDITASSAWSSSYAPHFARFANHIRNVVNKIMRS